MRMSCLRIRGIGRPAVAERVVRLWAERDR